MATHGDLYCFGDGKERTMHVKIFDIRQRKTPTICPPFNANNCVQIAMYDAHALALDIDGKVYGFGRSNAYGQLADLAQTLSQTYSYPDQYAGDPIGVPSLIDFPHRAIQISVGHRHSMILSEHGQVYAFGENKFGQLGQGDRQQYVQPNLIKHIGDEKIVHIACGSSHSSAISSNGDVFMWGKNHPQMCGLGPNANKIILVPTKVDVMDGDKPLTAHTIQCGYSHTLLLTNSHLIMTCGGNGYSKLGHGRQDAVDKFKVIESMRSIYVIDIAAGQSFFVCFIRW